MNKHLSLDDIDDRTRPHIYTQDYSSQNQIEGVKIIDLKNFNGEDGDLNEVVRFNSEGGLEHLPDFKVAQINRTRLLGGAIKGWHLHLKQDDLWYVLPSHFLFVGLWDVRKDSPTNGATMRISLGGGKSQLLLIPNGVAHGSANFTNNPAEILYIVNQKFNIEDPDEKRIPWDSLGADFWTPLKD